ncbi:MAG TPA: serine/threonine-protein kinase [Gemmataceae bacterium]
MAVSPAPVTVANFCELAVRGRLISADEAKRIYARWQEEGGERADHLDEFRRFVVAQGVLTEYQAGLLMRGHTDGLFLDPYRIADRLGRGRMAGVYRAVHPLGQVVAIKVLPASRARDPNLLARFRREARLAAQLDHPNVVRTFHVGQAGGAHFIVMEYLEGETLEEVLARRQRLPAPEAARLVCQALAGLQHIREKGMVHRDLKPANLMLVPASPGRGAGDTTLHATVKVLDIGLGRALFDEDVGVERLTSDGTLLGTPDYLAPEQARDAHAADIRADIYSLGCVLYHLLTGRPPFPDTNVLSSARRHAREVPRPLSDFLPEVPEGLEEVLGGMLAKHPARRYPTPARAARALRAFAEAGSPASAPAAPAVLPAYRQWLQAQAVPKEPPAADSVPVGRLKPAPAPRQPGAAAPTSTAPAEPDYGVELVPVLPRVSDADRPLTELSRRDAIMLATGGGAVLLAIVAGWGLSRLLRRDLPAPAPPPEPPPEPAPDPNAPPPG